MESRLVFLGFERGKRRDLEEVILFWMAGLGRGVDRAVRVEEGSFGGRFEPGVARLGSIDQAECDRCPGPDEGVESSRIERRA